jgi:excisionase family DNA binding protein
MEKKKRMKRRLQGPLPEPQFHTIPDVCLILGLGRTKVYDLIKREQLPVQKFGRATRVPVKHFEQWLQKRPRGIA